MSQIVRSSSIWLVSSIAVLAHCSVEFFIDQNFDQCSRDNLTIGCNGNTVRGGLCAYGSDMLWCYLAPDPCVPISFVPASYYIDQTIYERPVLAESPIHR